MAFKWDPSQHDEPVQSTDKEILFRDVPWGSSFNDTCKLLPEFELFGNTMEGLNVIVTDEILTGKMYGSSSDYDGEVTFYAMPMISSDLDVAGYPVYCLYLYYTYN